MFVLGALIKVKSLDSKGDGSLFPFFSSQYNRDKLFFFFK